MIAAPALDGAVPTDPPVLRIAHFTIGRCNPDSANGVDKTAYHLSRAEAALGHVVAVFSLTDKAALPIPGVPVATYAPVLPSLPRLKGRFGDLLLHRSPFSLPGRLVHDLIAWRPDIVHFHFVHLPQNVRLARQISRAGIPYCTTINGGLSTTAQRRHRWQKRLYAFVSEREYLRKAAFLHAISAQDVDGLKAYGVSNRVVVAPNGIDAASTANTITPHLRDELAARVGGKRIYLFLGRLDPEQKGLDALVRGFAHPAMSDSVLLLVGPDWRDGQRRLRAFATTLGIDSRLVFAGPAFGTEKSELLAACDVFVHPSRWEAGVPFSVLEAASLGKPLLLTRYADPSGSFGTRGAAITVTPDEPGIADGLQQFSRLGTAELRDIGGRARDVVEREFAWQPIARTLVDAYQACVRASHG